MLGCLIVAGRLGTDRFAELWLGGKCLLRVGMRRLGSAVTEGLCQSLSMPRESSRLAAFDAGWGAKKLGNVLRDDHCRWIPFNA